MRHYQRLSRPLRALRYSLAGLVLAALLVGLPGLASAQYMGAESCVDCHGAQYQEWLTSGHRFILMDSENARHRALPVPDGLGWDDISYAVGGHKTRTNYLDGDGYLLSDQYNLKTGEWSSIHEGGQVPYDCGACHTTGYDPAGSPEGLPGIVGTFALPGVQCEHCHGPGLTMAEGSTDAAFCGECHNHGPEDAVLAQDGFILSEGQYNEFLAGPHDDAGLGCVSCHNPHQTAEFGISTECGTCHSGNAASYAGTLMDLAGVDCEDCHMPPATLSAMRLGPLEGDMKSHVFNINTDASASMFTPDGSQLALSGGEGAVTLDFACQRCHAGASLETLAKFAKDFHSNSGSLENVGLNPGLTGTWWGGTERSGEGFLMEFAYIGPDLYFFGSFYTYDTAGNQLWLILQPPGPVPTDETTFAVDVYVNTSARWGGEFNPGDVVNELFGTGTMTFDTCTAGSMAITPNQAYMDAGFGSLAYDISRLFPLDGACPTFDNDSEVVISAN